MPQIITNPDALARIAALSAAVDAGAAGVQEMTAAVNDAATRERSLRASLAAHDAADPEGEPDVSAELSQMLAANPSAASSADWEGRVRAAQDATAAANTAWGGKRTIMAQALASVTGEVAAARNALADAKRHHEAAWVAFVIAARDAMTDELQERWTEFYAAVMGPLEALTAARRIYSNEPIYGGQTRWLAGESSLAINRQGPFGAVMDVKLYPSPANADLITLLRAFRTRLDSGTKANA